MSAPIIVSPTADTVLDLPQGSGSVQLVAVCQSEAQPTARLWKDLGWPFYSRNVTPSPWTTPVVQQSDGTWKAEETIYPPYAWPPLPSLDNVKRWIVFTNPDGTAASGKVQIRTV